MKQILGHSLCFALDQSCSGSYTAAYESVHVDIQSPLITSVSKRLGVHVRTRDRVTPQQVTAINIHRSLMNIQREDDEYLNYDGACGRVTRQSQTNGPPPSLPNLTDAAAQPFFQVYTTS